MGTELLWTANKKSYVLYRMAPFRITLSDSDYPQTIPFCKFYVSFPVSSEHSTYTAWSWQVLCLRVTKHPQWEWVWSDSRDLFKFRGFLFYLGYWWSYTHFKFVIDWIWQVKAYRWQITPHIGVVGVKWHFAILLTPFDIFVVSRLRQLHKTM